MKRAEITEKIETRRNESPDDEITLGETHSIALGAGYHGELRVEYVPGDYRLAEEGLEPLVPTGFFEPEQVESGAPKAAEKIVADLYWALVDLLFPQSSYLNEPWERLPLVVEIRYGYEDLSDYYASLGSYGGAI